MQLAPANPPRVVAVGTSGTGLFTLPTVHQFTFSSPTEGIVHENAFMTGDAASGPIHSADGKPQRVHCLSFPDVSRGDHVEELDNDPRSQYSFRSARSSTSRKSPKSLSNETTAHKDVAQAVRTSKTKDDQSCSWNQNHSSLLTSPRGDRERKSEGSQSSEAELSSGRASGSGSSTTNSGPTEIPGRVNSTVTKKQQRLLIDAVASGVDHHRKSTVASTRDPLDDEDDDIMMSDARDEPFEDDFEIDFQMLKVDEVVAPSRIAAGSGAQSIYVPPSAQQLILGMKRSLDNVERARRKIQQKYLEELHKRIALENELARLRRCITLGAMSSSPDNL